MMVLKVKRLVIFVAFKEEKVAHFLCSDISSIKLLLSFKLLRVMRVKITIKTIPKEHGFSSFVLTAYILLLSLGMKPQNL